MGLQRLVGNRATAQVLSGQPTMTVGGLGYPAYEMFRETGVASAAGGLEAGTDGHVRGVQRLATSVASLGETGLVGQLKALVGQSTYEKIKDELAGYHQAQTLEVRATHLPVMQRLIGEWMTANAASTTAGNLARVQKLRQLDAEIRDELAAGPSTAEPATTGGAVEPESPVATESKPSSASAPSTGSALTAPELGSEPTASVLPDASPPATSSPSNAPPAGTAAPSGPAAPTAAASGDVLCLGHGSLEFDQGTHPAVKDGVLIPPDTTLKFYTADHNVKLATSDNDYSTFNTTWRNLRPDWVPLQPRRTIHNYKLTPETREGSREQAMGLDWGGATVVSLEPGHTQFLCEGTPETCPTPALVAAAKAGQDIPAERWKHHCTGLLGQYQGNNIHWMVCTEVVGGQLDEEVNKYLQRGGPVTGINASRLALMSPEEKVAPLHEFVTRWTQLSDTTRAPSGDIPSAASFIKEVADTFLWAGERLPGLVKDNADVHLGEAGRHLANMAINNEETAAKVAHLAKTGMKPTVDLAQVAPENTTYPKEHVAALRAFQRLHTETLKPFAKTLTDILTPTPPPA